MKNIRILTAELVSETGSGIMNICTGGLSDEQYRMNDEGNPCNDARNGGSQ